MKKDEIETTDALQHVDSRRRGFLAKLIAGGMTLLPTMKLRLAQPSDLVDLSGIDGLDGIGDSGAANAGLLATQILAISDRHIADKIDEFRSQQTSQVLSNSDPRET